ncbi:MAG: rod shape-determining protein MreC [bacterium]|nr:rod shape-determining protein MreC [bacterium]
MTLRGRFLKFVTVAVTSGLLVFFGIADVMQPWRAGVFQILAPVFTAAGRSARAVRGWMGEGGATGGAGERARLLARLGELEALREENETLRSALSLRDDGEAGAIPAEAIAFVREGRDEYLILNRGTADGIGTGDIVVNAERVLGGTVLSVDPHASRVILFSSPSRSIDVTIPSADLRAIARGANARELSIELVPPDAAVQAGDIVLASPRATGGRRSLLLGEIREARQAEHEVFKIVTAIHLFDPADPSVIVLLAP